MEISNPLKTFKFDFWKDHFWIWALGLPVGLICWVVPFVVFIGLSKADNTPGWFPFFGFIFLGIPCYLLGWIFIYSLMEGIYTKVTLAESWVSIRLPWLIFPLIPVVKKMDLACIRRINLEAPYGSRAAVFLYYLKNNKERHFYLPRFNHNIPYLRQMMALMDRIEPPTVASASGFGNAVQGMDSMQKGVKKGKGAPRLRRRFIDKALYELIVYSFLVFLGISGWVTLAMPASNKLEAFIVGPTLAFLCFMLAAVCNYLPVIGSIAIWFLGRAIIHATLWLFQMPNTAWDTPAVVNQFLGRWNIAPIHSTLVEFLFWATLIISIELSISSILGWFERRAQKKFMRSQEEEMTTT
jgi:hypothetical protein